MYLHEWVVFVGFPTFLTNAYIPTCIFSLTVNFRPHATDLWASCPARGAIVIVARWRVFPRMTPANLFTWRPSLATRLAWPTSSVRSTDPAQVSYFVLSCLTTKIFLVVVGLVSTQLSASDDNLDGRTYLGLKPLLSVEYWEWSR